MEIKFWDHRFKEYDELGEYLIQDVTEVYEKVGLDCYGHATVSLRPNIEPHFYINGERVA